MGSFQDFITNYSDVVLYILATLIFLSMLSGVGYFWKALKSIHMSYMKDGRFK